MGTTDAAAAMPLPGMRLTGSQSLVAGGPPSGGTNGDVQLLGDGAWAKVAGAWLWIAGVPQFLGAIPTTSGNYSFQAGELATYGGQVWICKLSFSVVSSIPNPPAGDSTHWAGPIALAPQTLDALASTFPAVAAVGLNGQKLTSVGTGTAGTDGVNLAQVQALLNGLTIKASCQWATAAALPANTYAAGVLTAGGNGALTVDGNAVAVNDRIVVKNEAAAANNGIYVVTATGDGSHPYVLTRAVDLTTGAQVPGAYVPVIEGGTANSGTAWAVVGEGPYVIGTTVIAWTVFNNPAGGVTSIAAADGSAVVSGSTGAVTVRTGTLDAIATAHPPVAPVAFNGQKATGIANGTASSDAAAFGQIPTALPPNGAAGGDLTGTYPNPTVAATANVATVVAQSQGGLWVPSDLGFNAWNGDPADTNASVTVTSGTRWIMRVKIGAGFTASGLFVIPSAAGTSLTAGDSLLGLYNAAGVLIGTCPDQSAVWTSTGIPAVATLTVVGGQSLVLAAGAIVYVGILTVSTGTAPKFAAYNNTIAGPANGGLTAKASLRAAQIGTGQTTLASSFTPSTTPTASVNMFWVGIV